MFALFGLVAAVTIALAVLAAILMPTLPAIDDLADTRLKVPLRVYTADGELLAEFGEEKRIPVDIEKVPDHLIKAILAAEDHNFFQHHGVDFYGIARAAWRNMRSNRQGQGASTITMQVARNYFLSPEKTYTRKLREVLLAFKIERELSKQKILELYINKIFLGHRAYGFAAAAQIYFGTSLDKLTLPEMAMLAGLPKAPSRNNPLTNPESAVARRDYVLRHMANLGYIDQAALTAALKAPLSAGRHALRFGVEAPYVAELVRQYMLKTYADKLYDGGYHVYTTILAKHQRAANLALRRALSEYDRRHGYRGPVAKIKIKAKPETAELEDALKDYQAVGDLIPGVVQKTVDRTAMVYTQDGFVAELPWAGLSWARPYLDQDAVGRAPATASEILAPGDIVYIESRAGEAAGANSKIWWLAQIPRVEGALVALKPQDGAIVALAGGFDFYESSFNRATQAERQPGSSLKPFIYTAALEKGFSAATTVSGAPIVIEDAALEAEWRPENYSKQFTGPTRLRRALAQSLNLVSIRLLRAIGASYTVQYLERFGFDSARLPRNLSLALGTGSATPLQMAQAFAVFANGGFRVQPYLIARVEDERHQILEQTLAPVACPTCPAANVASSTPPAKTAAKVSATAAQPTAPLAPRVLSAELAFIMTSMMQDVIRDGTATAAKVLGRGDLAGKTGTTDDYRDAWFSGYNTSIAATAWVGFDQPTPLGRGEAGGRAALPMWIDYMRVALEGVPEQTPPMPAGVTLSLINSESGRPTVASDPLAVQEYFVKGVEAPTALAGDGDGEPGTAAPAPGVDAPPGAATPDNVREQLF